MLVLSVMDAVLAVCRLGPSDDIPAWGLKHKGFFSITRTAEELSIVCLQENVPLSVKAEKGWRFLKVEGPLDFGLTGILSSLAQPLAAAKISIFAISTYDTDYVLLKEVHLAKAVEVLSSFCKILG